MKLGDTVFLERTQQFFLSEFNTIDQRLDRPGKKSAGVLWKTPHRAIKVVRYTSDVASELGNGVLPC